MRKESETTRADALASSTSGPVTTGDPRPAFAALIARLEKATGPDRDLDWKIWFETASSPASEWPAYTASLDAALTLVPEGIAEVRLQIGVNDNCYCNALVARDTFTEERTHVAAGKTAPIALCIAALKARVATGTVSNHQSSVDAGDSGQRSGLSTK